MLEHALPIGEYWTPPTPLGDTLLVLSATELFALRAK